MSDLTQVELQHIRHFVLASSNCNLKLNDYASNSIDPQVKQLFTKAAQDALNTKETLMTFLN